MTMSLQNIVLATIAWTVLPLAWELPFWTVGLAWALLAYRALQKRMLPRWPLIAAVFVWIALVWLQWRTLVGRDAGVSLLLGMLALKTLETRNLENPSPYGQMSGTETERSAGMRDLWVIFYLSFFTLLTHFLFGQTLISALFVVSSLMMWIVLWVYLHLPAHSQRWRTARRTTLGLVLWGTPVMLVLFLLFPRFAPLWGLPGSEGKGKTGLSEQMQVGGAGSVNQLAQDSSIALRLSFAGPAPASQDIYIRGPIFELFDGQRWLAYPNVIVPAGAHVATPRAPSAALANRQENGQAKGPTDAQVMQDTAIRYTVTLEPSDRPWLLALDAMLDAPKASSQLNYRLGLWPQGVGTESPQAVLSRNLRLPKTSNPRTQAWAQSLLAASPTDQRSASGLSQLLLERLRTEGYGYSQSPGPYGLHSADEFWFDKKLGFCEHFATAYVIAMRAMGIPARVVTGYQGAERNPLDAYWVVRQSNAHAWAEIWDDQNGWLRVDPTAQAAPERIAQSERFVQQAGGAGGAIPNWLPTQWLWQARYAWDATNNRWNQWVLNYAQEDQLDVLKKLGYQSPSWQDLITLMGYALLGILLMAAAVGAALGAYRMRQSADKRLGAGWNKLFKTAQHHLDAPSHATPRDMMALTQDAAWQTWLLDLEQGRYALNANSQASHKLAAQQQQRALQKNLRNALDGLLKQKQNPRQRFH